MTSTVGRPGSPHELARALDATGYLVDDGLATVAWLAMVMRRPLMLEGEPGTGKTALAEALAQALDAELIRLQCYEGIDASQALYDWDFPRQVLHLRAVEAARNAAPGDGHPLDVEEVEHSLYTERFLLARPILRALRSPNAVLLVDEIDRADDEFEAFLLEVLSTNAVSVPELGRIEAEHPPMVVLTSNRTREVHDALKRRCLYHWVEHPGLAREIEIIRRRLPEVPRSWPARSPPSSRAARRRCRTGRGRPAETAGGGREPGLGPLPGRARPARSRPRDHRRHAGGDLQVPRGCRAGAEPAGPAAGGLTGFAGSGCPMTIQPDDKDWTWVLDRRCPECGIDVADYAVSHLAGATRRSVHAWQQVLERDDVATRPSPQVWSPLEYACHVRDVYRLFDERLRAMLAHDDPQFTSWDQDATADAERYGEQDPVIVYGELTDAGEAMAATFDAVPEGAWLRPGRRSNGSVFTVESLGRYFLHDVLHHLHDVGYQATG